MRNLVLIGLPITLALCSCATRRVDSRVEVVQKDTVVIYKEVVQQAAQRDRLVIDDLCDSLKPRPIKFKKVYVHNGDSLRILTNERNQLIVENIKLSKILKVKDSLVTKKNSRDSSLVDRTVYRKDWVFIAITFIIGVLVGILKPWRFIRV